MTAPAGPCEWCGGPQNWTIHAGDMYVRCQAGCQSMFPWERVDIPPVSEEGLLAALDLMEPEGGEEVLPLEGGAARVNDRKNTNQGLPF